MPLGADISVQGVAVAAALGAIMIATAGTIRHRLKAGKYDQNKVNTQRVVMVGFFALGVIGFGVAILRLVGG